MSELNSTTILELYCRSNGQYGSGVMVGPGIALTSAHLFAGADGTQVKIRAGIVERSPWLDADLVCLDKNLDCSLVRFPKHELAISPTSIPVLTLYGDSELECRILGFAAAADNPEEEFNDIIDLSANLRPKAFAREGFAGVVVQGGLPAQKAGWQGISGGPVFYKDGLCGIISRFTHLFEADLLKIVPSYSLLKIEGLKDHLVEAWGDLGAACPRRVGSACLLITPGLETALKTRYLACNQSGLPVRMPHRLLAIFEASPELIKNTLGALDRELPKKIEAWLQRAIKALFEREKGTSLLVMDYSRDPMILQAQELAVKENLEVVDARQFFQVALCDQNASTIMELKKALGDDKFDQLKELVAGFIEKPPNERTDIEPL